MFYIGKQLLFSPKAKKLLVVPQRSRKPSISTVSQNRSWRFQAIVTFFYSRFTFIKVRNKHTIPETDSLTINRYLGFSVRSEKAKRRACLRSVSLH